MSTNIHGESAIFTRNPGNPVLDTDDANGIWGPGYNSVVIDPPGNLWCFYHTKVSLGHGWEPVARRT